MNISKHILFIGFTCDDVLDFKVLVYFTQHGLKLCLELT